MLPEPVTVVSTTTGSLNAIIGIVNKLQVRHKLFKDHPETLESLKTDFSEALSNFETVKKLLNQRRGAVPQDIRDVLGRQVSSLNGELCSVIPTFAELESLLSEQGSSVEQAKMSITPSSRVNDIKDNLWKVQNVVGRMSPFSQSIINSLTKGVDHPQIHFQPQHHVQKNDVLMEMDFHAKTGDHYQTFEGRLKADVLDDVATIGAVDSGEGGVGKTCALRALAQEPDIIERFPGGIYFRSLGKDARIADIIRMLSDFVDITGGKKLAADMRQQKELSTILSKAQSWFSSHTCLFIVDDIWKSNDIPRDILRKISCLTRSADRHSGNSRILYSTRDELLAADAHGSIVTFEKRDTKVAEKMLLKAAESEVWVLSDDRCKQSIKEILDLCAGLPFNLSIAGRLVHEMQLEWGGTDTTYAWNECAKMFKESTDRLLDNDEHSSNYFFALDTSLKFLDQKRPAQDLLFKAALEAFCVLKRKDVIPLSVVRRIWGTSNERAIENILKKMKALGIVSQMRNSVGSETSVGLRVHDHVHAYATYLAEKNDGIVPWYEGLIRSYETDLTLPNDNCDGLWPTQLEDDGYIIENLCRLLMVSGKHDLLGTILRSGRWITKMMSMNGVLQLQEDVDAYLDSLRHDRLENLSDVELDLRARNEEALTKLCLIAVNASPICYGSRKIAWFQLYARLKATNPRREWMDSVINELEKWAPRPWLRPVTHSIPGHYQNNTEIYSVETPMNGAVFLSDGKIASWGYRIVETGSVRIIKRTYHNSTEPITTEMKSEPFRRNEDKITSVCLSQEDIAVSGHLNGTVRVWNFQTGEQVCAPLTGHTGQVCSVSITPDGSRVVSGSDDGSVIVWDVQRGEQVRELTGHTKRVSCVSITPNGSRVVSGSFDDSVIVWDVERGQQVCAPITGHTCPVDSVAITTDGSRVVSGSDDGSVIVWDVDRGEQACSPLIRHSNLVSCVSITPDGSRVASGSYDGSVIVWDVEQGEQIEVLTRHKGWVLSVEIKPDGSRVLSGSDDAMVIEWKVERDEQVGTTLHNKEQSMSSLLSAHTKTVSSVVEESRVAKVSNVVEVSSVASTTDGTRIVSASYDGSVIVWDVERGEQVCAPLVGHSKLVDRVAITSDGTQIVSQSEDGLVIVWDVESGTQARSMRSGRNVLDLFKDVEAEICHEGTVKNDKQQFYSNDNTIGVHWTGGKSEVLASFESFIVDFAVTSDGKCVAAVLCNQSVAFLRLED